MKRDDISTEELNALTSAIKKRYGIDFTNYEPKSLARGFTRLIIKHKLDSILGLWSIILKDREYFMSCLDDLTVNLTELFRNPEVWLKLKDEVLDTFVSKTKVSIWHAGCSSGEEVYTMGIVMKDKGLFNKRSVLATDLSDTVLAKAKAGKYSNILFQKYAKSFNQYLPNGNVEASFTVDNNDGTWVVKEELLKGVEFRKHNLVQDSMIRKFDIIFCRNVMIYFDDSLKLKVLKLVYDSLNDDGFFIVGYYDMLPDGHKDLFEVYDSKTRIYKKIKT